MSVVSVTVLHSKSKFNAADVIVGAANSVTSFSVGSAVPPEDKSSVNSAAPPPS